MLSSNLDSKQVIEKTEMPEELRVFEALLEPMLPLLGAPDILEIE